MNEIILNTPLDPLFKKAILEMQENSKTIRNFNFLKHCFIDCNYSFSEGRPVFIGLVRKDHKFIAVATIKCQNRKRGVWGRYATLTYAFTDWDYRKNGIAKKICRKIIDLTNADRIKSLIASKEGLELHRSLGHTFWGLNTDGKIIVDSNLFGNKVFFDIAPPQVRQSGGTLIPTSYNQTLILFKENNIKNYMYRDDPEEMFLKEKINTTEYSILTSVEFLSLKANTKNGEMLRWMDKKGVFIKKPALNDLKKLICVSDIISDFPWYFAGNKNGLVYRATIAKIGETRSAAIW